MRLQQISSREPVYHRRGHHAMLAPPPDLRRCASPATARQLQAQLLLRGLRLGNRAAVDLIAANSDDTHYARAIFDSVPPASANVYLWTAAISSYARQRASPALAAEGVALFRLMLRSGPRPNAFTATSVLKCCSTLGGVKEGIQLHAFLEKAGLGFSVHVGATLLGVYGNLGWVGHARQVSDEMPVRNVVVGNSMVACHMRAGDVAAMQEVFDGMPERDLISWNTLMAGYLRCGELSVARGLFGEMPQRNVNSWNMMIAVCSDEGSWADAVEVFNRMRMEGFRPDAATMAVLMSACAHLGSLFITRQVHGFLHKGGVEMNCHVQNALADMYAKCGSIREAHVVFIDTHPKDAVSYNVMIGAFAHHGHGRDALKLFDEMVEEGWQPDAVTFVGVLSACSHAGLVDHGSHYFDSMRTTYAIQQTADHYACMVDLYGRAGLIGQACSLVKSMPVEPHAGVWGALLNACRKHCHVEIGEIAARELIRIEPANPGNYVVLANTLARGRQWDAVKDVRQLMRGKGVDKTAGCCWVEVESVVHEFFVGDFNHPNLDEIYSALEHLYMQLI